ncbi:hypothetical protein TL16_g00712 [Triparma laevis f. inornata]|uniref:Uncharacterized protein n=1 Tax=Triparma laevis f. inornata TaxID=1714386 RepID=A0A9W6ZDG9_9STRA|nr:hypothetical protein TL16_g00712 [Triparma laevis f. inornata]
MAGLLKALGRKSSDAKSKIDLPLLISTLRSSPSPPNLASLITGIDVLLSPDSKDRKEKLAEVREAMLSTECAAGAEDDASESDPTNVKEPMSVIELCIETLPSLEFESKKSTSQTLLQILTPPPPLPPSFYTLLSTTQNTSPPSCLPLGNLLRHTLTLPQNNTTFLTSPTFLTLTLTTLPISPNFDVLSDVFSTLKTSLNAGTASSFLEEKYESFFDRFEVLLKSDNYVTRRFSLQLLSTVLLSRCNFNVMMRYISSTGAN